MKSTRFTKPPYLGFGLGLRRDHYQYILTNRPPVDWFEIISENYFMAGGKPLYYLDQIREHYPMVMHGVSLSIGGSDPLDLDYLTALKKLANRISPVWISDHLCWTGVDGKNTHDLLPIPYTEEALNHVIARVKQVQDFLQRPILLENVSSYLTFTQSELTEWEFLVAVAQAADCFILLDINNIFVNALNHQFDPLCYLQAIPRTYVGQFHLAGHQCRGELRVDTHDQAILPDVWQLYQAAVKRFGRVSTMVERDHNIPDFISLYKEIEQAKCLASDVLK